MDVPSDIVTDYEGGNKKFPPPIAIRALSDLHYKLGETYFLADQESVVMYAASLGEEKERIELDYKVISKLAARNASPYIFLHMSTGAERYKIKFAQYDLHKVKEFVELWKENTGAEEASPSAELKVDTGSTLIFDGRDIDRQFQSDLIPSLSTMVGLSAALHAMIYIDGEAVSEELKQFQLIVNDAELDGQGLTYLREKGAIQLIDELATFYNADQKRCLLANMIEIALVDRSLKPEEEKFIQYICTAFEIGQAEFDSIYGILLMKNNLSVF